MLCCHFLKLILFSDNFLELHTVHSNYSFPIPSLTSLHNCQLPLPLIITIPFPAFMTVSFILGPICVSIGLEPYEPPNRRQCLSPSQIYQYPIVQQSSVGTLEPFLNLSLTVGRLVLRRLTADLIVLVSSWLQWPCFNKKIVFHSLPPYCLSTLSSTISSEP